VLAPESVSVLAPALTRLKLFSFVPAPPSVTLPVSVTPEVWFIVSASAAYSDHQLSLSLRMSNFVSSSAPSVLQPIGCGLEGGYSPHDHHPTKGFPLLGEVLLFLGLLFLGFVIPSISPERGGRKPLVARKAERRGKRFPKVSHGLRVGDFRRLDDNGISYDLSLGR